MTCERPDECDDDRCADRCSRSDLVPGVEITYSILANGVEIGFGASGHSESVAEALHVIYTEISLGQWERVSVSAGDAQ